MTKKPSAEHSVEHGISLRSPTETDAIQALVTLANYLHACGGTSIALDLSESGMRIKASATYGWVNSLNGLGRTIT
ncbi:hypothetical protein CFBP7900_22330 [Xanthomonas hortorum pv. carotae]|uniref:Uncharacterized protein n=1 Tax=Xanthomonas hortorum pv. carotae TaxID=487904 RepID=A0A6V7DJV0_9XANT|nr:hypothetical protein CFBP7900_22130 [Xanthomonas hortorum pv. carotae]CAD0335760.1 hypothetical protein CFBP7900_22130 [Xanthomonas hortorum pv. carotae]CAD0336104.1 hypothetical protein CFBP7900_22330 [Xanthomonas hortorum pv. carotae]CAD0336113.1 hypothetical protein CFBP7900_22330 [Xanthomonas hortorum pv. carotae]